MDLISPLSNANYYTCRLVDLVIFVSILACILSIIILSNFISMIITQKKE